MNSFEAVNQLPDDVGLARILPESVIGKVLFWALLPTALLLMTLGIAFVHPCPWTNYLPFVALMSVIASVRWRVSGLIGSYLVLIGLLFAFSGTLPREMKLWQSGLLLTLALDFLIALLATQEIESKLEHLTQQARTHLSQLHQSELKLIQLEHSQAEATEKFEKELARLKQDAEKREVEKQQEEKRLDCLESEIEVLTSQKEELISDTLTARALANEKVHAFEELKTNLGVHQDYEKKDQEIEELTQRLEKARELYKSNVQELEDLRSQLKVAPKAEEFEGLRKQLEEMKTQASTQESQEELEELRHQLEVAPKVEELEDLRHQLEEAKSKASTQQQDREVEELRRQLEEMKTQASTQQGEEDFGEMKRQLSQSEGLYKQLRQQFEEKTRVLSQTRKDLFQTQGKYLALERQNQLNELDPDRSLEKEVVELGRSIEELESEITHLEELVSHTHSQ